MIAHYFPVERRGVANGIYNLGSIFGFSFSFLVGNSGRETIRISVLHLKWTEKHIKDMYPLRKLLAKNMVKIF
jgi:nitrate/nitrite transporter NarK